MSVCPLPPPDKKAYLTEIGEQLVQKEGKKKFYKPAAVKRAHRRSTYSSGLDFSCWGMSAFCSHIDFDRYHQQEGEDCDYVGMKREMLGTFAVSSESEWFGLPDWELDLSWLEIDDFFGGMLEGFGDFIGGIFDDW